SRYTGQEDVAVGTAVANRGRVEVEALVGFFVNTLVLRSDLSGNPTFSELLRRVSATALAAYSHQELPFEKLVEELDPERDLTRNSLFQVAFAFENVPLPSFQLADLEVDSIGVETNTSKFDLMLTLSESGGRLVGGLEYRTDLFARETVERMSLHLSNIFQSVTEDAGQNLSSVGMLSAAEVRQLTCAWNDTATRYPKDSCIHELFEQQAAHAPEATALQFGVESISYGELNRRANQLAAYLRRRGVGAESRVGVCLERGAELIVAVLGVLKAGGAYVPFDADLPQERIAYMLNDACVSLVVSESHLAEALPEEVVPVVLVDVQREEIAAESADDAAAKTNAENLAYVIYTSGSTGRPKGVAVSHQAVVRLVKETNYIELTPQDVVLQYAPVSFDASTFEVWGALLNGCKLVCAPAGRLSLRELGEQIAGARVTTMWLTAGLFHQMVEEELESLRGVKRLLAGGDVLRPALVERALGELPGVELINGYGPTENTTFTCCYSMRGARGAGASVPLGLPISNTRVYVLDESMRPSALGVYGELYVGGDGLARGYVNEPRLTAERFVPNPFAEEPGERLYRTGDIVRRLSDGNIEFLGRRDGQVKLRGFRVEAGEIESVLCEHERVGECVVVVREFGQSGKRLVAYVTPRTTGETGDGELMSEELTNGELRRYLKARLPEYMIPSVFVSLARLPLTPNGKIDRAALPEPVRAVEAESHYREPRNATEEILAGIWAELLGLERVGLRDDFFELGGHSLLATQVASRARAAFRIELPLRALFENSVLEDLAAYIANLIAEGSAETRAAASADAIYAAPAVDDEEVEALLAEIEQLSDEQARLELAATAAAPGSTESES
ncbi:MAG TPA: amino acid adenylation domain-containing protein, partial [Pyrinomonadaceae bacterium]|nr:amino acid adenylation domain-containing protein [Pyrinomonadaceae bacterium]